MEFSKCICLCHCLCLCICLCQFFLFMSCLFITLNKCLKGHKSLGLLLGGVLKMSLSLSIFLVRSCLFITLIKCLKGQKSLGSLHKEGFHCVRIWKCDQPAYQPTTQLKGVGAGDATASKICVNISEYFEQIWDKKSGWWLVMEEQGKDINSLNASSHHQHTILIQVQMRNEN